jgi:hypothetical protein
VFVYNGSSSCVFVCQRVKYAMCYICVSAYVAIVSQLYVTCLHYLLCHGN